MKFLEDIDSLKRAANYLGEVIENAPAPRVWTVSYADRDLAIHERDIPLILMAYVRLLARETLKPLRLESGEVVELSAGDIEAIARKVTGV